MAEDPLQYKTSANLARRADLHVAYGKVSWFGWLATHMPVLPGSDVVDIGCGPGWYWHSVAGSLPTDICLTLIDKSEGMVHEAQSRLGEMLFEISGQAADAVSLPFQNASFDMAVMMHMLYHVDVPERAIAEAARVLRPGGKAYATVNSGADLQAITDIILDVFGKEPMDFAAARVPLENLEALMSESFTEVTRHDMTDIYHCTDPEIIEAFILSMPPANQASPEQYQRLKQRIGEAFEPDGILTARKHSGVVCGTRPN